MAPIPQLYGLVLSGGKSTRMGTDKGKINYHGEPQREYLYKLLGEVCDAVYMSVRKEQVSEFSQEFNVIADEDKYLGPYNGLLSASSKFPEVAFLVLACDLPLFTEDALKQLVASRKVEKMATAFAHKKDCLPEPLCAIWEPKGLKTSISNLESGKRGGPRKFLINNDINLVFPADENVLLNANSKVEYKEAISKLLNDE